MKVNTQYQILWMPPSKEKYIYNSIYLWWKKEEKPQINGFSFHLKKLEKEQFPYWFP